MPDIVITTPGMYVQRNSEPGSIYAIQDGMAYGIDSEGNQHVWDLYGRINPHLRDDEGKALMFDFVARREFAVASL